jgi:hypothetical protein
MNVDLPKKRCRYTESGICLNPQGVGCLCHETLGQRLIRAAKEGVAIARGEQDPATYRIHIAPRK